jgi:hypothetical protein
VIPGIGRIAQNNATLSYLDPEHPELCKDCIFDMSISRTIAVNPPAGWTDIEDVNYTLNLKKGWNLISLPVTPENTTLAAVMSPVEGKYIDVAAWDGGWEYRSYAYGDWFGTLDSIEPKKGYWVNMKENANLIVHGQAINAFNITLHGGWNLIGWPSTQAMPVENLTVGYVDLATWDGGWIYRSYAYGDWFGTLSSIEPGKGYWLNIPQGSELAGG